MVIIGTGQDDPRRWVQAAYLLLDAAEQADPSGRLPFRAQIAAKLGICEDTVARAYRELTEMGIIYRVPGLGYFGSVSRLTRTQLACTDAGREHWRRADRQEHLARSAAALQAAAQTPPHRYRVYGAPTTHVRLKIFPDGSVATLRLYGSLTDDGFAAARRRWEETA